MFSSNTIAGAFTCGITTRKIKYVFTGAVDYIEGVTQIPLNTPFVAVVTVKPGLQRIYLNGAVDNETTTSGWSSARGRPLYIAGFPGEARGGVAKLQMLCHWDRYLSEVEAKSFCADPYQFLIPA